MRTLVQRDTSHAWVPLLVDCIQPSAGCPNGESCIGLWSRYMGNNRRQRFYCLKKTCLFDSEHHNPRSSAKREINDVVKPATMISKINFCQIYGPNFEDLLNKTPFVLLPRSTIVTITNLPNLSEVVPRPVQMPTTASLLATHTR